LNAASHRYNMNSGPSKEDYIKHGWLFGGR